MTTRHWKVGVVGTFDVQNYGDLLFPLIAARELEARLGCVETVALSYHNTPSPTWPFEVRSLIDLPEIISDLDALLIGGGYVIRFDSEVAPGYDPPLPTMHHPTSYWLTPALLAIQNRIPVAWNAPGMNDNDIPAWADVLMETAFQRSAYVAVRDVASRDRLARYTPHPIRVVPDTAIGIAPRRSLPPSSELIELRRSVGLTKPYIAVQASTSSAPFVGYAQRYAAALSGLQFVALPIGPALGDHADHVACLPDVVSIPPSTHPLLITDLIHGAEAVVGISYHLALTALAAGVPAFTPQPVAGGRFDGLTFLGEIALLFEHGEPDIEHFKSLLGRQATPTALADALVRLARHWDDIVDVICKHTTVSPEAAASLTQRLPQELEAMAAATSSATRELALIQHSRDAEVSRLEFELSALRHDLDEARRLANVARRTISDRHQAVQAIHASRSWRITRPLREVSSRLSRTRVAQQPVMDIQPIIDGNLNRHPYHWATITGLFSAAIARDLVDTFPHDNFKVLCDFAGEKDYEYEARQLTPMGIATVANADQLSAVWARLGAELTSPSYRAAMSLLAGRDLSDALLEVNVFHYGPRALLGPHTDLEDKIVTHVVYFNESWDPASGGCLTILGSRAPNDIVAEIPPIVDSSAVIIRADNSWHAVSQVAATASSSRRSLTATFYRPGSTSTMWPDGDSTPLHRYVGA